MSPEETVALLKYLKVEFKKSLHVAGAIRQTLLVRTKAGASEGFDEEVVCGIWVVSLRFPKKKDAVITTLASAAAALADAAGGEDV